jgi:tRNA-modifying protein YgfZ
MNTPPTTAPAALLEPTTALTHWGVIRARGADAATFLQSQLTNDVTSLGADEIRLAGFCSAKGRLQASFFILKPADDELLLACSASLLPATLKRLSMFVMRSRCKLDDASAELALHGLVGVGAGGDTPPWRWRRAGGGMLLRLPDVDGAARAMTTRPAAEPTGAVAPASSLDAWKLLEVRSGVPLIEAVNVDQFVPQMLNFELIGGVDFRKGCYPGQEVVARSQYRGTIKRRMFLFECDAAAHAGDEVFHDADTAQPAGRVVNAAPLPGGAGSAALVEVKLAALGSGGLHLGAAGGALLRPVPLPYAVPAEAVDVV